MLPFLIRCVLTNVLKLKNQRGLISLRFSTNQPNQSASKALSASAPETSCNPKKCQLNETIFLNDDKSNQPLEFKFPPRQFGKEEAGRTFQPH